ncbi:MAG: hypothetical protein R2688_08065 [Fimbriimonadaceae bacterium]
MIMDADGGNKTQVTSDSSRFADISWSPDGTQIGYTHRSAATSFIAQLVYDQH